MRTLALCACALAVGCGAGASNESAGRPADSAVATGFPIAPMTLVLADGHDAGEPICELRSDGAITNRRRIVARVSGDRVVDERGGDRILVRADGSVLADGRTMGRFDARGDLHGDRGELIAVDDAGNPTMSERGRSMNVPARIAGFQPWARRTAVVLTMLCLESQWSKPMT